MRCVRDDGPWALWQSEDNLAAYHAYHAARADLLRRLDEVRSRAAYDRAIELAGNIAQTAYLTRRRDELR
jgi:RNA polymerase sigma-70 factor (ECF subfamily)